jgi:hypothetical protein
MIRLDLSLHIINMKKLSILILLFLIVSCKTITPNKQTIKCTVTLSTKETRYSDLIPGHYWKLETDCGYLLTSNCEYFVGDTVSIEILDFTAMSHKQIY